MEFQTLFRRPILHLAACLFVFGSLAVIPAGAASNAVTTTVTAVSKKGTPPPIKKEDAQLFQGKERMQIADWRHGEPVYLAILIDDSLDSEAASQWNDLKSFINARPHAAQITVAYAP